MSNAIASTSWVAGPSVCEKGGGGVVLPLAGQGEHEWPPVLRVVLYGAGMVYLFLGVAIIADAFVAAIEVVTAKKRQRKTKSGRPVTEKVWNDTVATLSLMALGSSAPEIALSVVDLFKKEFHFTPLGAQTIAGSAAFNLLVIVAVCIVVIPSSETRKIRELPAFYVTAAVSVFAYFWLAVILVLRTPDVVEIWEAVATFLFLPMLIWVSYKVDVGDAARLFARISGRRYECEEDGGNTLPVLGFPTDEITVEADSETSKTVQVLLKRPENATGPLSVQYRTESLGAVPGFDYFHAEGKLEFAEDIAEQLIEIEIPPKVPNRCLRKLLLILEEPEGNVEFDGDTDGGKDLAIMTVIISTPSAQGGRLVRCIESCVNFSGCRRGLAEWQGQCVSSFYCLGSEEEQSEASKLDWVMHLIAFPWKMLFNLVPPISFFGGWACFYVALIWIGVLTIVISDLAELFGCVLGIRDDVTAITFVALGTSMPDLFASLSAAKEEPTADASIVNVTGSNSVNVFLGLGLPWTIGAVYWTIQGQTSDWLARYPRLAAQVGADGGGAFVVESRNLGFCVLIFSAACTVALLIVHLRRRFLGAELGGPFVPKIVTFCAFLTFWFGFIAVSTWRVLRWSMATWTEIALVMGGVACLEFCVSIACIACIVAYRLPRGQSEDKKTPPRQEPSSFSMRRSQSGLSCGSNISRASSNNSKSSKGIAEPGIVALGQGIALPHGVTGVRQPVEGIQIRVVKPGFQ